MNKLDLGAVSAYAMAKEKGYKGTEDEFATLMAESGDNALRAEEAKDRAEEILESIPMDYQEAVQGVDALTEDVSYYMGVPEPARFEIAEGMDHSSKADQVTMSCKKGETFYVTLESDNDSIGATVWEYKGGELRVNGNIQPNVRTAFTAIDDFDSIGVYVSAVSMDTNIILRAEPAVALTLEGYKQYRSETESALQGIYEELLKGQRLYLGDFIQAASSESGYPESTQRLSMKNTIALPYGPATKLRFDHAEGYVAGIRAGLLPTALTSNKYWYKNGDIADFSEGEQYYRIIYAKPINGLNGDAGYYDIDVDELETINPVVYFSHGVADVPNVVARNNDNLDRCYAAKDTLSASSHGNKDTYPVLLHISDTHGDYLRAQNAFDVADYVGVDALCITGDIVSNRPMDGAQWLHDMISSHDVLPAICTGNHDVDDAGYTDTMVYDYLFAPSADRMGNETGTTYYYTDIVEKSIRIIVTDVYQYGATTRSNTHMTSEQLSYIANAMKTAPAGYGIVILAHTPCVDLVGQRDENYGEFYQQLRMYGHTHYDIDGAPIYDIVDAFIGRTKINRTYTQTGTPSSISVSADFSGVDSSVEFIAHLTGHIHEDTVCYLPTARKQLMLNICCATAMTGGATYPYLSDDCDISKSPITKSQDAMNAYIIDRANKSVKIVRIGGNTTYKMERREWMIIPYA